MCCASGFEKNVSRLMREAGKKGGKGDDFWRQTARGGGRVRMSLAGQAEAGFHQLRELGVQDKDSLGKITAPSLLINAE